MGVKEEIHRVSQNVFSDIKVACSEQVQAKAQIMSRIAEIIRDRRLTQPQASKLLGIPKSKVSYLMNGKLSIFSLKDLSELLNTFEDFLLANDHVFLKKMRAARKAHRLGKTHSLENR